MIEIETDTILLRNNLDLDAILMSYISHSKEFGVDSIFYLSDLDPMILLLKLDLDIPKMKFLGQGVQKLQPIQTDRQAGRQAGRQAVRKHFLTYLPTYADGNKYRIYFRKLQPIQTDRQAGRQAVRKHFLTHLPTYADGNKYRIYFQTFRGRHFQVNNVGDRGS